MPRYSYICQECGFQYDTSHSYKIRLEDCPDCGYEKSLQKMLNNFTTTTPSLDIEKETGSIVKESIEDFRKELKQEKEKLSKREYKDD